MDKPPFESIDKSSICLVLTATIDVRQVVNVKRSDPNVRLRDYALALRRWIAEPNVSKIIFCENSRYDLSTLGQVFSEHVHNKTIEFLSFDGQGFPGHLGKGYGEMGILRHAIENSKQIDSGSRIVKVTGRHYINNFGKLANFICKNADISVACNLKKNLTFADSRVFVGNPRFFTDYLCPLQETIDENQGIWFEHVLAKATHKAISEGLVWSLLPCAPDIVGYSGTSNNRSSLSHLGRSLSDIRNWIKWLSIGADMKRLRIGT